MPLPFIEQLDRMSELFIKYMKDELTEEESTELNDWLNASEANQRTFEELKNPDNIQEGLIELYNFEDAKKKIFRKLTRMIPEIEIIETPVIKMRIWRTVAAASIIFVLLATGAYFWFNKQQPVVAKTEERFKNDVAPGGNKAILTLGDGSTIILDSAQNGKISEQGTTSVSKINNSLLAYNANINSSKTVLYNIVSTPAGGQYQVVLPDGSKVWLNAVSSLRFPTAFTGKERTVELTGEAYFEIAKDKNKPFNVMVNGMQVEVLGTHFNVMAYNDENAIKTTLLEGAVKVMTQPLSPKGGQEKGGYEILKPGQQAQVNNSPSGDGGIQVIDDADMEEAVAWKNGFFQFRKTDLKTILRQAQRWYDVDVVYEADIPQGFFANIPRDMPISKLLNLLELTDYVHFKIEGRKITVTK